MTPAEHKASETLGAAAVAGKGVLEVKCDHLGRISFYHRGLAAFATYCWECYDLTNTNGDVGHR